MSHGFCHWANLVSASGFYLFYQLTYERMSNNLFDGLILKWDCNLNECFNMHLYNQTHSSLLSAFTLPFKLIKDWKLRQILILNQIIVQGMKIIDCWITRSALVLPTTIEYFWIFWVFENPQFYHHQPPLRQTSNFFRGSILPIQFFQDQSLSIDIMVDIMIFNIYICTTLSYKTRTF